MRSLIEKTEKIENILLDRLIDATGRSKAWEEAVDGVLTALNDIVDVPFVLHAEMLAGSSFDVEVVWRRRPEASDQERIERKILEQLIDVRRLDEGERVEIRSRVINVEEPEAEIAFDTLVIRTEFIRHSNKSRGFVGLAFPEENPQKERRIETRSAKKILEVLEALRVVCGNSRKAEYSEKSDPLTNMPNQRMFWELLDYEVGRSERHSGCFSILFFDLDNFRHINEAFGIEEANRYLTAYATLLSDLMNQGEMVARYGGDEFVMILPGKERQEAEEVASKILGRTTTFSVQGKEGKGDMRTSVSIGMSTFPVHARSSRDLFMIAENTMRRAKQLGKNNIMVPNKDDVADVYRSHSEKILIIQKAVSEKTVEPYFQPIATTSDPTPIAYEVLMRIPFEGRIIPANEVIDVAEGSGIVSQLDLIVMEKAFAKVIEKGFDGKLFLNMSPKSMLLAPHVSNIKAMLRNSKINPKNVVFEITERETIRNAAVLEKFVREMKTLGVGIALDDFGSGFSSMVSLKLFPVDYIKIEGSFIQELTSKATIDKAIVASIATLARETGINVIAEAVESREIMEIVHDIGIRYVQGWFIGKPEKEMS